MRAAPAFIIAASLLGSAVSAEPASDPAAAARSWVTAHQREIVSDLARLVAIPNVPSDSASMRRNVETLRAMFQRRGFTVEIVETPGAPLVLAERKVPKAKRTLLLYAHYDGQPVDPAGWAQPSPFMPVLREGRLEDGAREIARFDTLSSFMPEWRLYARSASDDKGPIVALCAALDALAASRSAPTSNLRVLLDGEEESGSRGLLAVLPGLREKLRSDLMLFFDGPAHPSGRPTIAYGVRGVVTVDLTVYGPKTELHSGHYGNWVPNPASRLAALLASMKDDQGRVRVPGFYDGIAPLTAAEEAMLRAVPDDTTSLLRQFGIAGPDRVGATLQHAIQLPSLNVRGLSSADVGANARTIIPDHATAAIDIRLVRETRAADMVEKLRAHVRAQGFHVVTEEPDDVVRASHRDIVRLVASRGTEGYRTDPLSPDSKRVATSLTRAHGAPPVEIRTMGGTLPIAPIAGLLEVPAIVIPTVNFDNHQHSDKENLRLGHLFQSVATLAALLTMEEKKQ